MNSWDMSLVTSLYYAFSGDTNFNQNISSWDVSSVTSMYAMFQYAYAFEQNIGSWDITSVTVMTNMFGSVTLTTVNYDALLVGWEAQAVQNNVVFHGGNSKYTAAPSAAATARAELVKAVIEGGHNWTITDGGGV